jgi:hypothetical protein
MADATFGTFAIAFLAHGMKTNKRIDWVLAGISLGLTQYFFEAGRLFYLPLIALWLGIVIIFNSKHWRSLFPGLGMFVITALLIAMPTYYAAWARTNSVIDRLNSSGVGNDYWRNLFQNTSPQNVINHLLLPFLAYIHFPENALFYAGNHPMVLEYLVPIFLLGAFYLVWWWRQPAVIIIIWILANAGANLFIQNDQGAAYTRYIVGLPALAITMAAGVCYIVPMLLLPLKNRRIVVLITAVIAMLVCAVQVNYYFNEHIAVESQQLRAAMPFPDTTDAAIRMGNLPPGTQVYLLSNVIVDTNIPAAFLSLFRWNQSSPPVILKALTPDQITTGFLKSLKLDKDYAFFVEPGHDDLVNRLKTVLAFNDPQFSTQTDIPRQRAFILYYVPLSKQH